MSNYIFTPVLRIQTIFKSILTFFLTNSQTRKNARHFVSMKSLQKLLCLQPRPENLLCVLNKHKPKPYTLTKVCNQTGKVQ